MNVQSEAASVSFGPGLSNPPTDFLRSHLSRMLHDANLTSPVAVEAFFDLADRVNDLDDVGSRTAPRYFLLLDLQRFILFRRGSSHDPGIASLVRFLIDGYPLQPYERFASAERDRPYRFDFDPATLDLIPCCLRQLAPAEYFVGDLLTGELRQGRLCRHPAAEPSSRLTGVAEPARQSPLCEIWVDRGLRSAATPHLEDLVEDAAGIIRQEFMGENFASLANAKALVVSNRGAKLEFCSGVALSPSKARLIARCEATERFQIGRQPPGQELVHGSYLDFADDAVDPQQLFLGRSPECPDDEGDLFNPGMSICWTWAWGPTEGRWRLVPAQDLWFNTPELMSERRLSVATTSGCAVGATFEEACTFALLEAIERDAFLTSWYLRRPASEIDMNSFGNEELLDLRGRLKLALPGYRIVLFDITSDVGIPTAGALAIREEGGGPRVMASAAAHIDAETACFGALKELVRFRFRPDLSQERIAEVRARATVPVWPDAHFELYALDENFDAFNYLELGRRPQIDVRLMDRECPIRADSKLRLDLVLELLGARLHGLGAELYVKDITHPSFVRRGIRIARAITPGLYPMWFGGRSRRFAVTERLHRLAKRYTGRPLDRNNLQLAPHPMC